jgi:parallel beta-helix repeat protein
MALSRFVLPYADVGAGIRPSSGAKLFFYATGTSTPKSTFTDATGGTANTNPVIANANGVFPAIFFNGSFNVALKDSNDVQIWTADPVRSTQLGTIYATTLDLIASEEGSSANDIVESQGYTTKGDGGAAVWKQNGVTGQTVRQSPAQLGDALLNDANGNQWGLLTNNSINVKSLGSTGDGTTDDTATLQAALNTGKYVFIPKTSNYYKISAAIVLLSNQKIHGEGDTSQIRQITSLLNVIEANGRTDTCIDNLHLYCVGDKSSISTGSGIIFNGCSHMTVKNITVENSRGQGIYFLNTSNSTAINNKIINSPTSDGDDNTQGGANIRIGGNSSGNLVHSNQCISGNSGGIYIQTLVSGDNASGNRILGNRVVNAKSYGIVAYRNDDVLPIDQNMLGNIIANNVISTVTGTIINSATGNYDFGAGIYLQGAEGTIVNSNRISYTHSGAVTHREQLAPGAIGTSNCTDAIITNNSITNAGFDGIHINDPNKLGRSDGYTIVSGNNINEVADRGIRIKDRNNVTVSGNTITNIAEHGILCDGTVAGTYTNIVIDNNQIVTTGSGGVKVADTDNVIVSNNAIVSCTNNPIDLSLGAGFNIHGNTIKDATSATGIQLRSTALDALINGNNVSGCALGIRLDAPAMVGDNLLFSNTQDWFQRIPVLDDTGTPSVKYADKATTGGTTAITDFDDGVIGQTITILAAASITITDNARIILSGSANFSMTVSDTLTLTMFTDQIWQEVSRSVN